MKYAYAVRDALVAKGRLCELLFVSTHHEVIFQVQEIIINEEITHQENNKEPTLERGKARKIMVIIGLWHTSSFSIMHSVLRMVLR